ncbi:MAG: YgjV family protein [Clostridiales bacterium]|jgi:hypothetical protein|nr:YgjV family protein [Clostridiales bacterium]
MTMIIEIIGYIGSALVVVSMLMSSILRLRIINTFGSIISCCYALIVGAMPLALMNACLIIINLYNLYKLTKSKKPYDMAVCSTDDSLVRYFLDYNRDDILSFFPGFDIEKAKDDDVYAVMCEGDTVGMLLGRREGKILDIDLDYSKAAYRDLSVAKYLYSRLPESGINRVRFRGVLSDSHKEYLQKMGYTEEDGAWMLHVEH